MMDNMQGLTKWVIFCGTVGFALSADWSYKGDKGPSNWKDLPGSSACGGNKQSPINIDSSEAEHQASLGKFSYTGYDSNPSSMKITNNGHTAQVNLEGDIKVSGGGLDGDYKAAQFHFHWGSSDSKGSEHTINNKQFPMEVHIVHYSAQYPGLGDAVDQSKGLAVLGFMFQISAGDNPDLAKLISGVKNVRNKGDDANLEKFSLDSFLPSNRDAFYRYEGSLTTPKCQETVVWTVFTDTIKISQKQMDEFRQLSMKEQGTSDKILDNFRPVQPLNNRNIYSSKESAAMAVESMGSSAVRTVYSGLSIVLSIIPIAVLLFRH